MTVRIKCCALNSDVGPHLALLNQQGFEVLPGNRALNYWDADQLIQELAGCCAVVAGSEPYTREVIEALPELRVIARTGVGYDAVDLEACDQHQVVVATTPGVNHHAVAEHTIAMLMAVRRGFPYQHQRVCEGRWERLAAPRIMGQTLGLVGLGRIGQAVATRAVGLGMNVVASEPFPNMDFVEQWGIELLDFNDLLQRANIVSLHSPCTPETSRMINTQSLASMQPGSMLINTARGGLVDQNALFEALQSGHLAGAGLDVFDHEPLPPNHPLTHMSNVLLSCHVAGLDVESQRDTLTMSAESIIALQRGDWPASCVQNLKGHSAWSWERA